MRTCGELAELARTADFLGFDAFCRELCKSSSESYANRPVELDDLGKRSIRRQKASATYAPKYFDSLEKVGSLLEVPEDSRYVIYGGSEVLETRHGHVLSLCEAHRLVV